MVKLPVQGRVKTRLARDIGGVAATAFCRHAAANIRRRLAPDRRWRTVLAIAPDSALGARFWPPGPGRVTQGPGNLGDRMQRVMDRLPPGPAIIIGTDIPEIRPRHIARAFSLLGGHDAVLCPAEDGGYWLVGLRRTPRVAAIFAGVRWSSPHTLADTIAAMAGLKVAQAMVLADVDTAADHRRLAVAASRVVMPVSEPRLKL